MRLLLTGSTGFVGGALLRKLQEMPHLQIVAAVRSATDKLPGAVTRLTVDGLALGTNWKDSLRGVEVVIHCAARVHVMSDVEADPLAAFRRANVEGTLGLARQARDAGVRRFIFVSTIKVNGESTKLGNPFTADQAPAPVDPYGVSKLEAEQGLRKIAEESAMEVVIVRPTLVYGPAVKANFLNMMRWVNRGVPLPFGAIHNRRSLVSLYNLVDLIITCVYHPAAANQTFLVSDGQDVSTTELLRRIGDALGRPARLLPVPSILLEVGATVFGRRALSQRLCGSLQVDINKTRELLGWTPPVSLDDALKRTANYYLEHQDK
ncbi:UDP-glucose 4-epimerase family protein [Pseudomonas sp. Q1-7]|uniref:UDP-glucose 4-epimerase family protein n=1 Tax=Pseudomonas sp. Q1-7 TaxID=3020843 RepID=UPI002300700F|nr:SDR family oxidoreductase [Pseudomonas sp. Q1-7]